MSEGLREKIEELKYKDTDYHVYKDAYNKALDFVLALPELQQTIEDAERWNNFKHVGNLSEERAKKASQFDKMFERLEVKEECSYCSGTGEYEIDDVQGTCCCKECNGTGTISRPLNDEEKVEMQTRIPIMIQMMLTWSTINERDKGNLSPMTIMDLEKMCRNIFTLPSGKRVVRK